MTIGTVNLKEACRDCLREGSIIDLSSRKLKSLPEDCSEFKANGDISAIDLTGNKLSEVLPGVFPPWIQVLRFTGNNLSEVMSDVTSYKKLREIYCGANSLKDMSWVFQCRSLALAGLGYNEIDSIPPVIKNKNLPLMSLDLSHNNILHLKETLETLQDLPKLRILLLQGNPCSLQPNYHKAVEKYLPNLDTFDGVTKVEEDPAEVRRRGSVSAPPPPDSAPPGAPGAPAAAAAPGNPEDVPPPDGEGGLAMAPPVEDIDPDREEEVIYLRVDVIEIEPEVPEDLKPKVDANPETEEAAKAGDAANTGSRQPTPERKPTPGKDAKKDKNAVEEVVPKTTFLLEYFILGEMTATPEMSLPEPEPEEPVNTRPLTPKEQKEAEKKKEKEKKPKGKGGKGKKDKGPPEIVVDENVPKPDFPDQRYLSAPYGLEFRNMCRSGICFNLIRVDPVPPPNPEADGLPGTEPPSAGAEAGAGGEDGEAPPEVPRPRQELGKAMLDITPFLDGTTRSVYTTLDFLVKPAVFHEKGHFLPLADQKLKSVGKAYVNVYLHEKEPPPPPEPVEEVEPPENKQDNKKGKK